MNDLDKYNNYNLGLCYRNIIKQSNYDNSCSNVVMIVVENSHYTVVFNYNYVMAF